LTNLEIYNKSFVELFNIATDSLNETLTYQSVDSWDSVGHMELIARLESDFDIMIEMDDVIDFGSYEKGKQILQKYNVTIA
jgi:acyl carrier protein